MSPLIPEGLIVDFDHAVVKQLVELNEDRLSTLRGAISRDVIVILGDNANLPWITTADYIGRVDTSTNVLMPTHLTPSVPPEWLGRAVKEKFGQGRFVLDPLRRQVIDVTDVLKIAPEKLRSLLSENT